MDAIALHHRFHVEHALHPNDNPPYSYVYSPLTFPILHAVGAIPEWFAATVYWIVYAGAVFAQLWAGLWAAESRERHVMLYLAPLASFFPGLLANGILISGNVAYLLYAAAMLTAIAAWRGNSWRWFYSVVLIASCVKAPMLTLVVIPFSPHAARLYPRPPLPPLGPHSLACSPSSGRLPSATTSKPSTSYSAIAGSSVAAPRASSAACSTTATSPTHTLAFSFILPMPSRSSPPSSLSPSST